MKNYIVAIKTEDGNELFEFDTEIGRSKFINKAKLLPEVIDYATTEEEEK